MSSVFDQTFEFLASFKNHFDTSSFSFDRQKDEEVLDFLERQNFYNMDLVKNVHIFFRKTNLLRFDISDRKPLDETPEVKKVYSRVNDPEVPWTCHIAASYLAINSKQWSSHIFGFVSQNLRDDEVHTMLHSFNAGNGKEFLDTKNQSRCDYEEYWVEKYGKKQGIEKPRFTISDLHSYIGVRIPQNVTKDIFGDDPNRQENFWGYVKYKIFHDEEKTEWFIDVVNNNGEGWVHEPSKR
ncbi:MAG: hypothetical protein R3B39_00090 [Candidatus Paceibacterota bacterium]